jgi:hypothetical protein
MHSVGEMLAFFEEDAVLNYQGPGTSSKTTHVKIVVWQHIPARRPDAVPHNAVSKDYGCVPGRWNAYMLSLAEPM